MPAALELLLRGSDRPFTLTPGQVVTVGRTPQCDLLIEDPLVSRRHCTLELKDGAVHVQDLDSANGTFINEQPVREGPARAGDVLRFGSSVFDVRDPSAEPVDRADDGAGGAVLRDSGTIESVIQRRIEPAELAWLTSAGAGEAELALLERAQRHLKTLHRVSEVLAGARDLDGLGAAVLGAMLEVLPADRTALVLRRRDPRTREPEVVAARSRASAAERFTVSRTLVSDVIAKGISVFAHDASHDSRFAEGQSVIGQHVRSVMCVPLRTADEALGALYVDSLSGAGRFTEADLELLAAIGNQAGVALHRIRLIGELETLLLDTIRAITATIDARDGYTHRHSERVASLARKMATELGWAAPDIQTAQLSALLHDVGKIAVPDAILNKPGKLTREEYAEMQKHPVHGAQILANIQSPTIKAVLPGVAYHHERWDGGGYPEGLKGEAIPILGRLLGVADVFDALTSARSYRGAMPPADAMRIIVEAAGRDFDPKIAAAAARLFDRGELQADPLPSSAALL